MLILDIETFQIKGKTSIWEFAAIDTITSKFFHWINGPMINQARKLLSTGFNVRFFEDHHIEYCLTNTSGAVVDNKEFYVEIKALLNQYKVISAYNVNFDYRELKKQGVKFPKNQKRVCLWGSFINAFITHKYVNFCLDNQYLSDKGNIQTSAEIAYRYLSGDTSYIHQHTALSDCFSELRQSMFFIPRTTIKFLYGIENIFLISSKV